MSLLQKLFGTRKTGLADVSSDDIKKDLYLLEIEEKSLQEALNKEEKNEKELLTQYKHAREAGAENNARFVANKIKAIKPTIEQIHKKHQLIIKNSNILRGLEYVKSMYDFQREIGGGVLAKLSMADLEEMIEQAIVDDKLQTEKLDKLLGQVAEAQADNAIEEEDLFAELDKKAGVVLDEQSTVATKAPNVDSELRGDNRDMLAQARREESRIDDILQSNNNLFTVNKKDNS